jgi:hypothetical protein
MTKIYQPRGDSLAAHVIGYFRNNPEEELSMADIGLKWAEPRAGIKTKLAGAIEAGMLKCSPAWVYSAGDKLHETAMPAAAPATAPARTAIDGVWSARREGATAVDPATVPLDDGVPFQSKRASQRTDWTLLLNRMQPGHSCLLPREKRCQLTVAIAAMHKAQAGKFATRTILPEKTQIRLWRLE